MTEESKPRVAGYQEAPVEPLNIKPEHVTDAIDSVAYENVPVDIYRFFNVDIGKVEKKDIKKLKEISKWAFSDEETLGDGLKKLKDLEIKLGQPRGNETRYDKLYNWILIERDIQEMRKKQKAFSG